MGEASHLSLPGKVAHAGFHAIGQLFSLGIVMFLVLAWVVTGPFFQLAEQSAQRKRLKLKS